MKTPWTLVVAASLAVIAMLGMTGPKARTADAKATPCITARSS